MTNYNPTYESLETELRQVLDRHRELLGTATGYTVGCAMHILEAERARYGVDVEEIHDAGPDGVWFVEFSDGAGAMLGIVGQPEKRAEVDIDIAEVDMGQSRVWSDD